jgi:hypothetical protein
MRKLIFASALLASLAGCEPYNPDLGGVPYRCAADMPRCPDGYFCNTDDVCENIDGVGPDSGDTNGFQCDDDSSIEGPAKNDTVQTAFMTPVSGTRNEQTYGGHVLVHRDSGQDARGHGGERRGSARNDRNSR